MAPKTKKNIMPPTNQKVEYQVLEDLQTKMIAYLAWINSKQPLKPKEKKPK